MRRDTKLIFGSIIVLTTVVVIGSFFAVIQFQYAEQQSQTQINAAPVAVDIPVTSELVVVHLAVPVTVERFGVSLELTAHEKINDTAITSSVTVITPEAPTPAVYTFTGIGESQITPDQYTIRIVNATAATAQILIGK